MISRTPRSSDSDTEAGALQLCPWSPSPRRSNQFLHDRRGRGTLGVRHPHGPPVDQGRQSVAIESAVLCDVSEGDLRAFLALHRES